MMKYLSLFSGVGGFELGIENMEKMEKKSLTPKDIVALEMLLLQV